jgi:hypothetical protein
MILDTQYTSRLALSYAMTRYMLLHGVIRQAGLRQGIVYGVFVLDVTSHNREAWYSQEASA